MLKRVLGSCAAGFLFVAAAIGADCSGIWTGQLTDKNGDIQDLSFRFELKDNTLTGKMYGDNESMPIQDAVMHGNEIAFSVTTELNGSISKFVYSGQIEGNELTLVRLRAAPKPTPDKPNQPQTVKLKRIA